jgi:hypothetical protein
MAFVRVHYSPGFPLGEGFPAEQFAPAWWQETAGGEEKLPRRTAQQNEAPPAELNSSLEGGVLERVAPAVFGFPQRGEFPGEQTVWFFLRQYSKYAEHHMYSSIVLLIFLYSWQGCQLELIKIPLKILLFK